MKTYTAIVTIGVKARSWESAIKKLAWITKRKKVEVHSINYGGAVKK